MNLDAVAARLAQISTHRTTTAWGVVVTRTPAGYELDTWGRGPVLSLEAAAAEIVRRRAEVAS